MKKNLLKWAVIFHAIMYSVSLLYVGYQYGEGSLLLHQRGPEYFILPVVDLVLLIISVSFLCNREYGKSKSYFWMGSATLVYGCWKLGSRLFFYYQERMTMSDHLDIYVYPGTVFGLSCMIAVIYFVCAIITRKEDQNLV